MEFLNFFQKKEPSRERGERKLPNPYEMCGVSQAERNKPNEDSILIYSPGLMAVFDGVGGERGGAEASRTACQWLWYYLLNLNNRNTIIDRLVSTGISETEAVDALWRGLSELNDQIFRGEGLGTTTATVGMICQRDRDILVVAHVGDSRAYILRQGKLFPITIDDQPFLDKLEEAKARQIQSLLGKISRKEEVPDQLWPYFKQRHMITKAVGAQQVNYSSSFPKIYKDL